jgi:hypothetical protein
MAGIDPYKIYSEMLKQEVILFYTGKFTPEFMDSIYQMFETKFGNSANKPGPNKKLFHIMVECLQNIYKHGGSLPEGDLPFAGFDIHNSVFMILKHHDGGYRIVTGNYITAESIAQLKADLDKINTLNRDDLKAYYLEKLSSTELSEKGGAGLGLIDIARKSGNKLDYRFDSIADSYSFFSLIVKIDDN